MVRCALLWTLIYLSLHGFCAKGISVQGRGAHEKMLTARNKNHKARDRILVAQRNLRVPQSKQSGLRYMNLGFMGNPRHLSHAGFWGLVVEANVPGLEAPQHLLFDTGSSTLAFCNASLFHELKRSSRFHDPPAGPTSLCTSYGPASYSEYFYGSIFNGDIDFDSDGTLFGLGTNISFATMEKEVHMTCQIGFDGIMGAGFGRHGFNVGLYPISDPSVLFNETTKQCCSLEKGDCGNGTKFALFPGALHQFLRENDAEQFGVYWSGKYSEKETDWPFIQNAGQLFIGSSATDDKNPEYDADTAQSAKVLFNRAGSGWYEINVTSIRISGNNGTKSFETPLCKNTFGSCIIDSGTPTLALPSDVLHFLNEKYAENFYRQNTSVSLPTVEFSIEGVGGGADVKVTLGEEEVKDLFGFGHNSNLNPLAVNTYGDSIVLGLPLFKYQYFVFSSSDDSTTGSKVIFNPRTWKRRDQSEKVVADLKLR